MYLTRRKTTRPLGYVLPESKVEIQIEKALFRNNVKLLGDMINLKRKSAPPRSKQILSVDDFAEKYKIVNNAKHARYHNPISQKVVGENIQKYGPGVQIHHLMCDRQYEAIDGKRNAAQCDVLGPHFCTECTRLRKRTQSFLKHQLYFPDIEVHSKYLVAPEKTTRILLERENAFLVDKRSSADILHYGIAKNYTSEDGQCSEVFTEDEICQRIKSAPRTTCSLVSLGINYDDENEEKITGPPNSRKNSFSELPKEQTDLSPTNDIRVTFSFSA